MAYSKVLTNHLSDGAGKNYENLSEQLMAQPRQTEHILNATQALPIQQVVMRDLRALNSDNIFSA
jgi:hypothetical protein